MILLNCRCVPHFVEEVIETWKNSMPVADRRRGLCGLAHRAVLNHTFHFQLFGLIIEKMGYYGTVKKLN